MLQFVPQRRQMLLDDRVERRILRLMALVAAARADRVLAGMRLHSGVLNEPALCAPRDLFVSGRYVDRYERRGDVWKIAYRCELVDWVRDDAAADGWFHGSGMLPAARKPADRLYDREAMRRRS